MGILSRTFEDNRSRLASIAYRLLGTREAADDAVQETWIRLSTAEPDAIHNIKAWLTTVVARVCLDQLRSRKSRREDEFEDHHLESLTVTDAEDELLLADTMGPALLVVLDSLAPAERIAFVLHDLFDISFETIATVLGRSEVGTRQLASRARRKVSGPRPGSRARAEEQSIVQAFLLASRHGDFNALLQVLDPGVVLRADDVAIATAAANKERGAPQFAREIRDPAAIAELFKGKAVGAQLAWIDGAPGSTWIQGGKPRVAFVFSIEGGKIKDIRVIMDGSDLEDMAIELAKVEPGEKQ